MSLSLTTCPNLFHPIGNITYLGLRFVHENSATRVSYYLNLYLGVIRCHLFRFMFLDPCFGEINILNIFFYNVSITLLWFVGTCKSGDRPSGGKMLHLNLLR